jgi:hypothetical protein
MKSLHRLWIILFFLGAIAACSINIPWDVASDYDGVFVILRVSPDDADVLLNGRYIGAAYEFASSVSALRLASRENELAFRKKGFREKVVDLRDYSSRNITVRVELASLEGLPAPAAPTAPPAPEDKQAYEASSEPLPPPPAEKPAPAEERDLTQVTLSVTPEETAVYIDGKFWGLAPEKGTSAILRLAAGKYIFSAFHPGFKAFAREVTVPRQEKFSLAIALEK